MRFALTLLSLFIRLPNAGALFAQEVVIPPEVAKRQAAVPDTVLYAILLHQVATFKDKADELDRRERMAHPIGITWPQNSV